MRPSERMPTVRRGMTRGRIWALVIILVILVVLFLSRGIAVFYTDYLWFDSVHLGQTWRGVVGVKVGLAAFFIAVFALICWVSLFIADRSLPDLALAASGPEDELVQRYRSTIGRYSRVIHVVVSVLLGLAVGAGASGEWNNWILFRNSGEFHSATGGILRDPQFHKPDSFFVFRLPFIEFLIGWAFAALVVITIVTIVAHYLNGGIRIQARGRRVGARVKVHLSVLLALLALVKAIGYYFQRFQLDTSTRGFVEGASYTDVHAQLPAINLLMWVSVAACILFVVNIQRQGWALPAVGLGLWLLLAIVVGGIYPALVQNFTVKPAENQKELPYIARDITATRFAMGIENVKIKPFPYKPTLSTNAMTTYSQSLTDAQLWDPTYAIQTFDKLQDIRSYYQFNALTVDRYPMGPGQQMTPVVLGVRSINDSQLPASGWVNQHLQYTHGYGVALAPGNQVTGDQTPNFSLFDLPPTGSPPLDQPSVYFGINLPGWVIAHTRQPELDYQYASTGATQSSTYTGSGGVQLSSFLRKLAFAIRFGDKNIIFSSLVTSDSRLIFVRDIQQAVEKAAPFLQYDADPYAVVMDGGIYWVQDAYTTTNNFPYAQPPDTTALNPSSGLANTPFNYVRNSVKILINAYTGKMTFYVMDQSDPIIRAYEKAFPGMFVPASKMDSQHPSLRSHLRYPEDLMTVQSAAYGSYHITNASGFYSQGDAWEISQDPGTGNPASLLTPQTVVNSQGQATFTGAAVRMPPVYQVIQLPGSSTPSFTIMEPMVPYSSSDQVQNLTSFMVGLSDPGQYGQLIDYVLPRGETVDGPALVDATMAATQTISKQISLLNTQGSEVRLGDVLPIPVGDTIVYVRPLYVQSSRNPLPQLEDVIVVDGKTAVMDTSLAAALGDLTNASLPSVAATTGTPAQPSTGAGISPAAVDNLARAQSAYSNAQAALSAGNLGEYQADINQMEQYISQAQQAFGPSGTSSNSSGSSSGSPARSSTSTTSSSVPPTSAARTGSALAGKAGVPQRKR